MSHCGNKSIHSSHDSCSGTQRKMLAENIVMNLFSALMLLLTLILIHRWIQKRR